MALKNAIGGISLIAGTAIGGAILVLPISTAHLGFTQTVMIYAICWIFMTLSALYLLEVNLWAGLDTNLITMAQRTLGSSGKVITWVVYLLLLYTLTAAYLTGAGDWFLHCLKYFNLTADPLLTCFVATILTVITIMLGTHVTDWVNRFLIIGLLAAFGTLIMAGMSHIDPDFLFKEKFPIDLRPIPTMVTGFGFAIVIPSLTAYLKGNIRQLFYVVLIGSVIPLLVYVTWELTVVGIIPLQDMLYIQKMGHPVIDVPLKLQSILNSPLITQAASYFSIFALVTSLLGVSLSLFDFLADGLHITKNIKGKFLLALVSFVPPLLFIIFYSKGFGFILSFAGIFVAILLGILPSLMAYKGRYYLKEPAEFQIIGGKSLIFLNIIFFSFVIVIECFNQWEAFTKMLAT